MGYGTAAAGGGDHRGTIIGGVSILAVFAVLCLAVFALLALLRADSDLKLSRKTAETAEAYYQADSQAEQRLAAWIPILKQSLEKTEEERNPFLAEAAKAQQSSYDQQAEEITFRISVFSGQWLSVVVKPMDQYPYYEIVTWKEENQSEYGPQQSLPVWDGGSQP